MEEVATATAAAAAAVVVVVVVVVAQEEPLGGWGSGDPDSSLLPRGPVGRLNVGQTQVWPV